MLQLNGKQSAAIGRPNFQLAQGWGPSGAGVPPESARA